MLDMLDKLIFTGIAITIIIMAVYLLTR